MPTLHDLRIGTVWRALGGGELRRGRGVAFWRRKADGFNIAINEERGTWFDHVAGVGGGPLRLVEVALGMGRADALRWLEDRGLIDPCAPRSPERQAARRRQAAADALLSKLAPWRRMRTRELEREKRAALGAEDFEKLKRAASILHRIENGSPGEVVAEFLEHQRRDSRAVQRLIEAAAEDERHALMVAAYVTNLLANSVRRKVAA